MTNITPDSDFDPPRRIGQRRHTDQPPTDDKRSMATEQVEKLVQSAWFKLVGLASVPVLIAMGNSLAGKVLDRLDRIDVYMSESNKNQALLTQDVRALQVLVPKRESEIKEIRDQGLQNKYQIEDIRGRLDMQRGHP